MVPDPLSRMQDLEFAEKVLEEGASDYISFARPLIADPDLPNKLKAGEGDCVRRCVGCNHCTISFSIMSLEIRPLRQIYFRQIYFRQFYFRL